MAHTCRQCGHYARQVLAPKPTPEMDLEVVSGEMAADGNKIRSNRRYFHDNKSWKNRRVQKQWARHL